MREIMCESADVLLAHACVREAMAYVYEPTRAEFEKPFPCCYLDDEEEAWEGLAAARADFEADWDEMIARRGNGARASLPSSITTNHGTRTGHGTGPTARRRRTTKTTTKSLSFRADPTP